MEDMSGDLGAIMNAPALPKPPRYKGSSMQERRYFLRAYYTYFHALKAFQTEHNRPFVKTVGSCIEQAKKTAFEDYAALDVAMKKLSVDTKLVEAESRVNRLQANMYKILEDHNMVDVMFDREQKKLVKNNSCGKSRVLRMNLSVTPRAQVLIAMNILSRERSYLRWVVLNGTLN
ncbi:hypothetical protein PC115_g12514 [Phytophthora cactorum]|uniref:Uncharacterized protein n=1 Tax=Phytophthora cactorum TaxID=29920 RepID=A0A8T1BZE5_9STRA|nr:hypothetical protein PC115_g12514 [Phytophthora cactorum]